MALPLLQITDLAARHRTIKGAGQELTCPALFTLPSVVAVLWGHASDAADGWESVVWIDSY